jgi:hypothetical protein
MIRVTMSSKILQWRRGDGGVGAGAFDQFAAGIAIALVAPSESLLRLRPSEQRHVPSNQLPSRTREKIAAVEEAVTGLAWPLVSC